MCIHKSPSAEADPGIDAGARRRHRAPRGRTRRRVAVVALVALAAGCGSVTSVTGPIKRITTERAVGEAFLADAHEKALTATLSLGVTAAQVERINRASGDRRLPASLAKAISSLRLVLDVDKATGHASPATGAQFAVSLDVDGNMPAEIRDVRDVLYARVDFRSLLSDFGQRPSRANALIAGLDRGNATIPGLAALARGQWVSTDLAGLAPLFDGASKATAEGRAAAQKIRSLLPQVGAALERDATFVNSGDHGGRTEYTVTVATRAFVERLLALFKQAITSSLPAAVHIPFPFSSKLTAIPATQKTVFQVWVKDNRVAEIDLDLRQFDPKAIPIALPLRLVLSGGTPVSAPSGAVNISLAPIVRDFAGMAFAGAAFGGNAAGSA